MQYAITFIGGSMDLQRLVAIGEAPPYYRVAKAPALGAVYAAPQRPGLVEIVTEDYKLFPIPHDQRNSYMQHFVGILMETPE